MIPEFGTIFSNCVKGANTPIKARLAMRRAFYKFWNELLHGNKKAAFDFAGTVTVGTVVSPMAGKIASFNDIVTKPVIPTIAEITTALATKPNPWTGIFQLFANTLQLTPWQFDCKVESYFTTCPSGIVCATAPAYAEVFKQKMEGIAPNTHEEAMAVLSDGVKEFLQTVITEVPYSGTGVGQLTGSITVQFEP